MEPSIPSSTIPFPSNSPAIERHYSVAEAPKLWSISPQSVIRLFQNEPGVEIIGSPETVHKRGHRTLRVPESVLETVHQRLIIRAA